MAALVVHDVGVDSKSAPSPMTQYRPRGRWQWLALWGVFCFSCLLIYLAVLIVNAPKPLYGGAVIVTAFAVLVWLWVLYLAFAVCRPIRITDDDLFIPGLFSTVQIPVDEVAGVGLLFKKVPVGSTGFSGWYPYVWRRDGTAIRLTGFDYTPRRWIRPSDADGKGRLMVTKGNVDEMHSTNPGVMAMSAAGQLVAGISSRVIEIQGPSGLLASQQMQKRHVPPRESDDSFTAYWSPDGEMRRLG